MNKIGISKKWWIVLMLLCGLLPSCYCGRVIDETEVGLHMSDGISVDKTLGPGRHQDWSSAWSKLVEIDVGTKTGIWTDPDVATRDKQQIGVEIGISYRRGPTHEAVLAMYGTYRQEATNDEALWRQVQNRIARVIKNITTSYSLDQLMGVSEDGTSRAAIAEILKTDLQRELDDVGVTVVDVGINNISPSDSYRALLEQKAAAAAAVEIAEQNRLKAVKELEQTTAETDIAVELARRDRLVAEEEVKVYAENPLALELEKMRILASMYGDKDKIIIVPAGTDLNMILGGGVMVPTE